MLKRFPLFALALLAAGCGLSTARYNRQVTADMSPWVGKSITSVIQEWGPPDSVYEEPSSVGAKNYVWKRRQTINLGGETSRRPNYNTGRYDVDPGQTINRTHYRLFVVDKDGVITGYKFGVQ